MVPPSIAWKKIIVWGILYTYEVVIDHLLQGILWFSIRKLPGFIKVEWSFAYLFSLPHRLLGIRAIYDWYIFVGADRDEVSKKINQLLGDHDYTGLNRFQESEVIAMSDAEKLFWMEHNAEVYRNVPKNWIGSKVPLKAFLYRCDREFYNKYHFLF